MTDAEKREAARQFYKKWNNKGKEDEDDRSYWIDILQRILGVDNVTDRIEFQKKVVGADGNTKRIDAYIPETRVLIEQKSLGIALDKPQYGHDGMTPYEQAKYYDNYLRYDEKARWIVVSNFAEIWIYDMNAKVPTPVKLLLADIIDQYSRLNFLINAKAKTITQETELSLRAGELVGKIYDCFLKQYSDPTGEKTQNSLNVLCVRLVFCLYAEDARLFGSNGNEFSKYIGQYEPKDIRLALIELFKVLDTPIAERDEYLEDELAAFPYVNGGLFANESIVIPKITEEIKETILESAHFDWSKISPTIFGAVFESTLNPETRRSGGMHYTSIENIHKVIDPLFLDDLKTELAEIRKITVTKTREKALRDYQDKLAALKFLDPACGSGNFLTETYVSIRRLENEAVEELNHGQVTLGDDDFTPIKVSISQFYGIEINDFAVTVAKTALWIAESQMMKETEDIIHLNLDFLPLKTNAYIVEGNALRLDWNEIVNKDELSYIMGNPPFIGYSLQSKEQKDDILSIYVDEKGKPYKTAGKIDYVSGWYFKAAQLMEGTEIRTAFVSTNSITQGEQVAGVWKPLYDRFGIHIDFAHRTFRWDSEASIKAHVHCVIVGFSVAENKNPRLLYDSEQVQEVEQINAYLFDADCVFVEGRTKPIHNVAILQNGGKPTEGGFLILSAEEKDALLKTDPLAKTIIRPYMMGKDFIDRKPRYCLWMVGVSPTVIKQCPHVIERIEQVRQYRLASPKAATRKKAETPMLFDEVRECTTDYVAIPKVSSENRRYIPMEYLSADIIPGDKLFMLQNAGLYEFGVLTSNVHMAWMRAVCGRLKSDYSYSNTIVYNNFPWPTPTEEQKAKIEQVAQAILDARALYPDCSLADLYDPLTMPQELRRAHQQNDKAVMQAYGFSVKDMSEADCVAALMKMYQELTK